MLRAVYPDKSWTGSNQRVRGRQDRRFQRSRRLHTTGAVSVKRSSWPHDTCGRTRAGFLRTETCMRADQVSASSLSARRRPKHGARKRQAIRKPAGRTRKINFRARNLPEIRCSQSGCKLMKAEITGDELCLTGRLRRQIQVKRTDNS